MARGAVGTWQSFSHDEWHTKIAWNGTGCAAGKRTIDAKLIDALYASLTDLSAYLLTPTHIGMSISRTVRTEDMKVKRRVSSISPLRSGYAAPRGTVADLVCADNLCVRELAGQQALRRTKDRRARLVSTVGTIVLPLLARDNYAAKH